MSERSREQGDSAHRSSGHVARATLPPGQRRVPHKLRFGTHLHQAPPKVPEDPVLTLHILGAHARTIPLAELAHWPRTTLRADFHCVAGWTATDLEWQGILFGTFWRDAVRPLLPPRGPEPTHLVLVALDGYRCVVDLRDALADNVLIADTLDGEPLDRDQGAPARLVSPDQYGFISTKHLTAIEVHDHEPAENFGTASRLGSLMVRPFFARHPRSRVWHEERNAQVPTWLIRPFYRAITPPIAYLSARGSTRANRG